MISTEYTYKRACEKAADLHIRRAESRQKMDTACNEAMGTRQAYESAQDIFGELDQQCLEATEECNDLFLKLKGEETKNDIT